MVLSCPEECVPHADALAIGEGVQLWPQILRDVEAGALKKIYRGSYLRPYREDPAPRRDIAGPRRVSDSHQPDRDARLSQPLRVLLPLHRRVATTVSDARRRAGRRENSSPMASRMPSSPTTTSAPNRATSGSSAGRCARWSGSGAAAVSIDATDDPSLVREMALAGCTGVFVGFESLSDANLADARKKTPRTEEYASRVRILHDHGIQVNGSFVLGFDHDKPGRF